MWTSKFNKPNADWSLNRLKKYHGQTVWNHLSVFQPTVHHVHMLLFCSIVHHFHQTLSGGVKIWRQCLHLHQFGQLCLIVSLWGHTNQSWSRRVLHRFLELDRFAWFCIILAVLLGHSFWNSISCISKSDDRDSDTIQNQFLFEDIW